MKQEIDSAKGQPRVVIRPTKETYGGKEKESERDMGHLTALKHDHIAIHSVIWVRGRADREMQGIQNLSRLRGKRHVSEMDRTEERRRCGSEIWKWEKGNWTTAR